MLLHGFPEFWWAWRRQIAALAAAGFRVWAPDLRGFNLSDRPRAVVKYHVSHAAQDILGLMDAAGVARAAVVGHDWGGAVAWWLSGRHADRLSHVVTVNSPHPAVYAELIRRDFDQVRRSWYFLAFQMPWLPERALRARDWRAVADQLVQTSRPGAFSEADLACYRQAWRRPGAARSMINWYRANVRRPPTVGTSPIISVPALVVWGMRDAFLSPALAAPSADLCAHGRLAAIDDGTHWVHHEFPDSVTALLNDFLSQNG